MRSQVRTLQQAHEFLNRQWPGRGAPRSAWLDHHQVAAEVYTHVARVDLDHHHEALYLAGAEREHVRALTDLGAGDSVEAGKEPSGGRR
jgi:hypothetical protein